MIQETYRKLGEKKSVIRDLFEYGRERKAQIGADNVFDFSLGNPNVPAPEAFTRLLDRLLRETPPETLHAYSSAPGMPEARKAVSEALNAEKILPASPDLIYLTCGAAAALTITLSALMDKESAAAALSPCFPEYKVFAEQTGGAFAEIPGDRQTFAPSEEALNALIGPKTALLLINSPNNPTGAVLSEESLTLIAQVLKQKSQEYGHRIYLVSDEPYRELVYTPSLPHPGAFYPHTVVCYSFSKSLSLPGERIGYIAVSREADNAEALFNALCGAGRALGYVCAPTLMQHAVKEMLPLRADFSVYRKNRDLLYAALTEMGFSCVYPEGAFYLFLRAPDGDGDTLSERAKAHELLLVPGRDFGSPAYVRIAYCVKTETAERALPAFSALAKEYGLKG